MFRFLNEAFQDSASSDPHLNYINQQDKFFKSAPNLILSSTPGLTGFDNAIKTVNTLATATQDPVVSHPDDIFMTVPSRDLSDLAQQCASSSLDALIASKNPSSKIGCGWLYTPPPINSPYPLVSKGFIGNAAGPMQAFDPPNYKQWFFNLQLAKKQSLLDKCKALKSCTDIDSDVFKGFCGYCTNTNQGVPIDNGGNPLYPGEALGNCDSQAIVRSADKCPPPPPPPPGPQPYVDRTCDPVNGRLSTECLRRQVITGGCSNNGALAIALAGSPNPNDYVGNIRDSLAVKIYNRSANPPLNLEIFRQGRTTASQALNEVRQIVGNTNKPESSALGASARDLCLRKGAIQSYDTCSELSDGTTSPFELRCLQQLFLKMGGQPAGKRYPTQLNIQFYNSLQNLGAVKQYIRQLMSNMYINTPSGPLKENFQDISDKYQVQRAAMIDFLGIEPEKALERAPYSQGVEVFWFVPVPGNPNKITGFLKRTIERDFVQLPAGPSRVSQLGGGAYGCMLQLTDLRAQNNFSVKFRVTVDDGFWIAVNQPANIDRTAMSQRNADSPGLFENLGLQGPTTYQSNQCSTFQASTPNIIKMYFEDAGGGWNAFQMNTIACSGNPTFQPTFYSLTCEERAPFLTFEVNTKNANFEELRNPGLFEQFIQYSSVSRYRRTDERMSVPGKKGFGSMNNQYSTILLKNIAYQSWKTCTIAIRFKSIPINDDFINLYTSEPAGAGQGIYGNFSGIRINAKPNGGGGAKLTIESQYRGSRSRNIQTPFIYYIDTWYLLTIKIKGNSFIVESNSIPGYINSNGRPAGSVSFTSIYKLVNTNVTENPAPGQSIGLCRIKIGNGPIDGFYSGVSTPSFNYDIAWVHFFEQETNQNDILRDCKCNWIYTQFPSSPNTYTSDMLQ
jgi:hypothetical protein